MRTPALTNVLAGIKLSRDHLSKALLKDTEDRSIVEHLKFTVLWCSRMEEGGMAIFNILPILLLLYWTNSWKCLGRPRSVRLVKQEICICQIWESLEVLSFLRHSLYRSILTEHFINLVLRKPSTDESNVVQTGPSPDIEALKLSNVQLGL